MDAKKVTRWQIFRRTYFAPPTAQPRWKREQHVPGKWFDISLMAILAACFVGWLVS